MVKPARRQVELAAVAWPGCAKPQPPARRSAGRLPAAAHDGMQTALATAVNAESDWKEF